jgi:hypothetical protein
MRITIHTRRDVAMATSQITILRRDNMAFLGNLNSQ